MEDKTLIVLAYFAKDGSAIRKVYEHNKPDNESIKGTWKPHKDGRFEIEFDGSSSPAPFGQVYSYEHNLYLFTIAKNQTTEDFKNEKDPGGLDAVVPKYNIRNGNAIESLVTELDNNWSKFKHNLL